MKKLVRGLILVMLLSIPMVVLAVEQPIPVQAQIPGEFSCTITDEFASVAGWYPTWTLPSATTTTTLWGNIRGSSNYDWQVSADMGSVGSLVNTANPSIHLDDGLKIVMESWPESDQYVDGWSHHVTGLTEYTPFDNDYSFKQTVANELPGTYSGTVTFTCVNLYGGTCGDGTCNTGETVTSCPADCAGTCGDGTCNTGETVTSCPADCAGTCGDGTCNAGETITSCPADCATTALCGNSIRNTGEQCDDGNTAAGDGCSATCTVESGYICTFSNFEGIPGCSLLVYCNDGSPYLDPGEECDPGLDPAGCSATCKWICDQDGTCDAGETSASCPADCPSTCGNNVIDGAEQCDDGNTAAGDGCSATCSIESGYICTPLGCEPDDWCGDGYQDAVEQCEPPTIGCDTDCAALPGYVCDWFTCSPV